MGDSRFWGFVGAIVALAALAFAVYQSSRPTPVKLVASDVPTEPVHSPSGRLVASATLLADTKLPEEYVEGFALQVSATGPDATAVVPVYFDAIGPYEPHLRFQDELVLQLAVRTRACVIDFDGRVVWVCRARIAEWRERERLAEHQIFTPLQQDDASGAYRLILDPSGKLKDIDGP